jgi:hypothetical protein
VEIDTQVLHQLIGYNRLDVSGFKRNEFGKVARIVRRFYCTPRNLHNLCPTNCELCKAALTGAMDRMSIGVVQRPEALLTWLLRKAVNTELESKQQAVAQRAAARTVDAFGTKDTSNVFDALLDELV